jgi:hypothetical protein
MATLPRIALLFNVDIMIEPGASGSSAFAYELVRALVAREHTMAAWQGTVFGRRGPETPFPMVSLDTSVLPSVPSAELGTFARNEAAYTHAVLAGLLDDFDLIHVIVPLLSPLLLLARTRSILLQTRTASSDHPANAFLQAILGDRIHAVGLSMSPSGHSPPRDIAPAVDLAELPILPPHPDGALLFTGGGEQAVAHALAERLRRPLLVPSQRPWRETLAACWAVVHLSHERDDPTAWWIAAALAAGRPVGTWAGGALDHLARVPERIALAPRGDIHRLAGALCELSPGATAPRREAALAHFGARAAAARYHELYRHLLRTSSTTSSSPRRQA